MMRLWQAALLGMLGMLYAPTAQAGPVWSLNWQFGTGADISNTGRSAILFTPHNTISSATGSTALVAGLTVRSTVPDAHPDPITHQNFFAYLKLTDLASHSSRLLWFSGYLSGTLSQHTANLTYHLYNPISSASIHLGSNFYSIGLGPVTLPSTKNHLQGSLDAKVSFFHLVGDPPVSIRAFGSPVTGPGGVHETPEPASGLLAGMGLALVGFSAWRRRQRKRQ